MIPFIILAILNLLLFLYFIIELRIVKMSLDYYTEKIKGKDMQYDIMLTHIMTEVLQDAIRNEDYELAEKVKDIISKIGNEKENCL